ncbi:MAG TPA: hypothetical protein VHW09_31315 [Bryobacteraceae bacterium]|jgi:hypothetical protein|nr:hypothetical protein [Bryobacteraceae bacterium]
MEAQRSQFAIKFLPSLTDFAFLLPIAFLFGRMDGVQTLLSDCDTGWHIRTGDWMLTNRLIPTHDVFSFSKPNGVWYAWEWLSDLIFSGLNHLGGLRAVVLLAVLLLSVIFTLVFRMAKRRAGSVVAIVITVLAVASSSVHWLARPHLFTLLFLVLFFYWLERVRAGATRIAGIPYFVLLPAATMVWTNLHGGFIVGIVMVAVYGAGELLTMAFSADPAARRPAARRAAAWFGVALACLAASLANPYGWRLHVHLFEYLRDPYASEHIAEFFTLSFHHPAAVFFEPLLVLSALSIFWFASRGRYTESLLLVLFAHAGLLAARNIPLFAIVSTPLVAEAVEAWLVRLPQCQVAGWLRLAAARFNEVCAQTTATDSLPRLHAISAAGFALVAAILFAPAPPKHFRAEYDPKSYPAAAIEVLRHVPSARIFTDDEWGDYLIWRLYPTGKVFVDGRSDFYGDDFENKYIDVLNVKRGWEQILDGFGVNTILLPPSTPLSGVLKESSHWHTVYDDGVALIFRPVEPAAGKPSSAASKGGGAGREGEVMRSLPSDRAIAKNNQTTRSETL